MIKEINMYVFSTPVDSVDDLDEWITHFKKKGIYCAVEPRVDGKFELLVEGKEADCKFNPSEPVAGPCMCCGNARHVTSNMPKDTFRFKFCSSDCMEAYRNRQAWKYWGCSWKDLQDKGIAGKESV